MFITISFWVYFVESADAAGNQLERLAGKDRFEVAVNVSIKGWPEGSNTILIANYTSFADALAASPFAYKEDGPILLTQKDQLSTVTKNEILRLQPKKAYIIGGNGSVSDGVLREVDNLVGEVQRIGGKDRFEVAENLAKRIGSTQTAIITNGLKFPDALSIAPYAAKKGYPILLTTDNKLPVSTEKALIGKKNTLVIGGEGSVGKEIYNKLPVPMRIGGKDRFEVSANIVRQLHIQVDGAYLATGLSFADALTGSVMAAKDDAPLLLTRPEFLPAASNTIISNKQIKDFVILGGKGSVQEKVESVLTNLKITSPVVYFVPHADDEVLTYAIDIRNQISKGRKVYLVLLSKGEDSGAREILNGVYDGESSSQLLTGHKAYCSIHKTYHDPITENYLHGYLSEETFGVAREEDFFHAVSAMGVPENQAFSDIVPLNDFTEDNIKPVLNKYIQMFPDADFRTMSMYDVHEPHAEIGKTLKSLEKEEVISPFKTLYFVSVYTDRFARINIPYQKYTSLVEHTFDKPFILNAMESYEEYHPEQGRYAIGYHSVASQFNSFEKSMYAKFHH
jgi:N-acetylmuramoyl-L-alanine amidase